MRFLLILILLAALGGAAFITKPTEAQQKAHVDALLDAKIHQDAAKLDIGKVISGGLVDVIRVGKYEDKTVYSTYAVTVAEKPMISCIGAFSTFFCSNLETDEKAK